MHNQEVDEPVLPGQFTLPRQARLTHRKAFDYAFAHGQKHVGRAFVCYVVRDVGKGNRLGMAVSRRVGCAVVRNRVKRYIREYYRVRRCEFALEADLVVVARPAASRMGYAECADALERLLRQGGVVRE